MYDEPDVDVENVARRRSPSATFSTEGHHDFENVVGREAARAG